MRNYPCSQSTRHTISKNLRSFSTECLSVNNLRRAAVALTVVDYRNEGNLSGLAEVSKQSAALLLTRRAGKLRNHAGQWALPGGSIDEGETAAQAALRELREEVGLELSNDHILGFLDDFVTRSGFHITPVVFWAGEVADLQISVQEVASVHRIPLAELSRKDSPVLETGVEQGRPVLYMVLGSTYIAAPTAAILFQFKEVALNGSSTRVSHYDQPYFAWK